MGGKNATVVLDDADVDKAAAIIQRGAFGLSGQACTGTSRVLVARPLHDALLERLAAAAGKFRSGRGPRTACRWGRSRRARSTTRSSPMSASPARRAPESQPAARRSATTGMPAFDHGYFLTPAVIADVPADSRLLREEIFGPVVALRAFDGLDEALAVADETEYGLAVSLVTNHLPSVIRFARETRHGVVKVNGPTTGVSLNAPFGGFKHSSNQAAKEQGGATVMDFYTRIKTVYLGA